MLKRLRCERGASALRPCPSFLRGFQKITGTPKADSSFDFEFVEVPWTGTIGPVAPDMPSIIGVQLCGVDHASERCDV